MIIFPAIDIKDGKVVRLLQGKFDQVTEYSKDPVTMAKQWEDKGAQWLHVIDLDGAKDGIPRNSEITIKIAKELNIPVQTGGGIRSKEAITKFLSAGLKRIILGTKAVEDLIFLKNAVSEWKNKIAVSLDCVNGMVAQRGWVETSTLKATTLVKELEVLGLECLIYTDIARDGMLTGPNIKELQEMLAATTIPLIASGGLSSIKDIQSLLDIRNPQLIGAITGKAIYEGKLDLIEAQQLANSN